MDRRQCSDKAAVQFLHCTIRKLFGVLSLCGVDTAMLSLGSGVLKEGPLQLTVLTATCFCRVCSAAKPGVSKGGPTAGSSTASIVDIQRTIPGIVR